MGKSKRKNIKKAKTQKKEQGAELLQYTDEHFNQWWAESALSPYFDAFGSDRGLEDAIYIARKRRNEGGDNAESMKKKAKSKFHKFISTPKQDSKKKLYKKQMNAYKYLCCEAKVNNEKVYSTKEFDDRYMPWMSTTKDLTAHQSVRRRLALSSEPSAPLLEGFLMIIFMVFFYFIIRRFTRQNHKPSRAVKNGGTQPPRVVKRP